MIWDNFKDRFHESWHPKLKPFIESEECDKIYAFLKKEGRRGKKIAPLSSNTFKCFELTSYDDLKVVMVGLSPYHTLRNGLPVADGLLMSCSITGIPQPSLDQFYGAIERELYDGLTLGHIKNPDLTYLAQQGVLLFNASLTTEINKPGSHLAIWEPFTKYLFEDILSPVGVPFVLLGKEAGKLRRFIGPFQWIFEISHPASAAYKNTDWSSEGAFKSVNKILKERNNDAIEWLDLPF